MCAWMRIAASLAILGFTRGTPAQTPLEQQPAAGYPPAPAPTVIAATVNGQEIPELAIYRGLLPLPAAKWATARGAILNHLIDNLLVDQYVTQLKIRVEPKEVEDRFAQIQDEAKKNGQDFQELLKKMQLSEAAMRKELQAALCWDKFVQQQATEKVLLDFFQKNPAMFDGSQTHARHILVSAKDDAEGQAKIAILKKSIEEQVGKELAKLPPQADKLTVDFERSKATLAAFAVAAERDSTCPSKNQGGDLGWFRRVGDMVEPFARTAFALQPYQLSDAVKSEFGYHLILTVERKPGREVKFEDVKPFVMEIYAERLRDAIIASYKPRSKIVINEARK